jgi:hypothetical protein
LKLANGARRIPMTQLLHEESVAVFDKWRQLENKTRY